MDKDGFTPTRFEEYGGGEILSELHRHSDVVASQHFSFGSNLEVGKCRHELVVLVEESRPLSNRRQWRTTGIEYEIVVVPVVLNQGPTDQISRGQNR